MSYQRLPIVSPKATAEGLLGRAQQLPTDQPLTCLQALLLVDSARWLAWPQPVPAAAELEQRLMAAAPDSDSTPPGQLLSLDLAARRQARSGTLDQVTEALGALPDGYATKSLWLRWREALGRHQRPALWDRVRHELSEAIGEHSVPPSETLAALLGEIDLPRWRAQNRLQADALDLLRPHLLALPPGLDDNTRRVYLATAGRALLELGDEVAGAKRLHAAGEGLPLSSPAARGRLFSRPSPDAAVWLRQAVDRAQRIDGEPRETLLLNALCGLIHVSLRHTAGHLLAETLDPRPVRFDRADATALVLAQGASAWLFCEVPERPDEWAGAARKLALRHPRSPLIGQAVCALSAYQDRLCQGPGGLNEVAAKLAGDAKLQVSIELARLRASSITFDQSRLDDPSAVRDSAYQALASLYRLAKTRHQAGAVRPAAAIAGALADIGRRAEGLALFAILLDTGTAALPAGLPTDEDVTAARGALLARLDSGPELPRQSAPLLWSLAQHGEPALAGAMLRRTVREGWPADPWQRFGAALSLAQAVGEGCDPGLPAAVERAAREESQRVIERLRVDDPGDS